jgi:hypothetical protein
MFKLTNVTVLLDVVALFSSIVVLTPNGQFVGCATTALSERYVDGLRNNRTGCGVIAEFSIQD